MEEVKETVLVLLSRLNHKKDTYERIFTTLKNTATKQRRNLGFHLSTLDELWIKIIDSRLRVTEPKSGKTLKDFDFVEFNWWGRAKQQALAAAVYLKRHGVPFLPANLVMQYADTKIAEMALMSDGKVRLPNASISSSRQILKVFSSNPPLNFPVIVKDAAACGGRRNFLVDNFKDLQRILEENPDIDFVVQEFIPNNCDYRCLVLGDKLKLVIERSRISSTTYLNNTSSGDTSDALWG